MLSYTGYESMHGTTGAGVRYVDETRAPGRRVLRVYEGLTPEGEAVVAEFCVSEARGAHHSIMGRWVDAGCLPAPLKTWWSVSVQATKPNGDCKARYNPTERRGGAGYVIAFEWLLEATPENMERISDEIVRRSGLAAAR